MHQGNLPDSSVLYDEIGPKRLVNMRWLLFIQ